MEQAPAREGAEAMIAAFTYDDYECGGIKRSFRGLFESPKEILATVRGGRSGCGNLETMDLETCEFHRYEWVDTYDFHEDHSAPNAEEGSSCCRQWLTHKWKAETGKLREIAEKDYPDVELKWDGKWNGRYGHGEIFYLAGAWEEQK
jgi:hypothetical protein